MIRYLFILISVLLLGTISILAQDTISIEYCLEKARSVHPRLGSREIIEDISMNNIKNARTGYLPQAEINGMATYQSDVVEIAVDLPFEGVDFPVAPKDQYKIALDVSQAIYDGGLSRNRQRFEIAARETDLVQLELEIHATQMQVKDLYFNILILQKNEQALELTLSQIDENHQLVISGIMHGIAMQTDSDLLMVEEINLEQKISEIRNNRKALLAMLGERIGEKVDTLVYLAFPSYQLPEDNEIRRREEIMLDLQKARVEESKAILKSQKLPVLYGFGQFGYGNPGLNMLNDKFDTYYIIGAKLKWNILDWNTVKRNQVNLGLQQDLLESSKQKFEEDIRSALLNQEAVVQNHIDNIDRFLQILEIRSRITSKYSSQLKEGVIKAIDLVSAVNQERTARIQLETEKVLLQQSIAKYLELKGDL